MSRIYLSENSYIVIDKLPDYLIEYANSVFDEMCKLRPEVSKVLVGIDKKELISERGHASYLNTPKFNKDVTKSYMFSGYDTSKNNDPLPKVFEPFYDYLKDKYNQVVVNWYTNGDEFIPLHSDCEVGFKPNADIAIVSFGCTRPFVLKSRSDNRESLKVHLTNGSILYMCGKTQDEYRHGISKDDTKEKRISITFRSFI